MRISSKWRVKVSQGESAFIRKRFPYPPPFCILSVQCVVFIPTRSIVFFAVYSLLYSLQCIISIPTALLYSLQCVVFILTALLYSVQCVVFIPTALLYSVQCILYFILCSVKLTEQYRSDYTAIVLQLTNALHLWCVVVVLCYTNLSHTVGWELEQKSEIGSSGWFGWLVWLVWVGGFFVAEWHQLVSTRSPEAPLNHHIQTSSLACLMESWKYNFSRGFHLVFGRFCAMWLWLEGLEPLSFWWHDRFNPRCAVAVLKSPLPCDG